MIDVEIREWKGTYQQIQYDMSYELWVMSYDLWLMKSISILITAEHCHKVKWTFWILHPNHFLYFRCDVVGSNSQRCPRPSHGTST
jgi:hypothetical protein